MNPVGKGGLRPSRRIGRAGLDVLRRRPGARQVQGSSPAIRGGNNLYLWLWAHIARRDGERALVLRSSTMDAWMQEFPVLRELTLDEGDLRLLDARVFATRFFFDHDFTREQCALFCRDLISSSPSFRRRLERARGLLTPETCVVNVRRGDYYERAELTERFGIDVEHHVREALELAVARGREVRDVLLVSDDVPWCLDALRRCGSECWRVDPERRSPFDDLAVLASSTTLVLANSTFSYWGSYLAASRDAEHLAIAPSHHEITHDTGRIAPMFDPRWPRTNYRRLPGTLP